MPTAPRWRLVNEHAPVRMATRVTGSCVRVSLGPHIRLGAQGGMGDWGAEAPKHTAGQRRGLPRIAPECRSFPQKLTTVLTTMGAAMNMQPASPSVPSR